MPRSSPPASGRPRARLARAVGHTLALLTLLSPLTLRAEIPPARAAKPRTSALAGVSLSHDFGGTASVNTNTTSSTTFTLNNLSVNDMTINLVISVCNGALAPSNCTRSPASVFLPSGQSTTITTGFKGGTSAGNGTLTLRANNTSGTQLAIASVTVTVTAPPPHAPTVSLTPHVGDRIDVGLCTTNCFETTFGYTTPAYVSRDMSRSVTLLYRSGRARPYGRLALDVSDATGTTTAFRLQLTDPTGANVTFTNGSTSLFFAKNSSGATRVIGEFDAGNIVTSAKSYTAYLTSYDGTTAAGTTSAPIRIIVVNGKASFFGAGVDMVGFQRIYDNASQAGGVLITDGSGSASFFSGSCTPSVACTFTSPGGDFSVLTTGSNQYKRTYPDGAVVTFDAAGNELSAVTRFGVATSFAYSTNVNGAVVPWAIGDGTGSTIDLRYRSTTEAPYQPGSLTTITAPTGGRRADFRVYTASGNLEQVLDFDNLSYGVLGYDTQHRLTSIVDKKGGTTNYTYAYGRTPAYVDAPSVVISTGASVQPRVQFREQYSGLYSAAAAGGGNAITNLIPVPAFDIRAAVTDPRGNSIFYSLNRFGSAQRTYTPLYPTAPADSSEYSDTTGLVKRTISSTGVELRYTWSADKLTNVKNVTLNTNDSTVFASQYSLPIQTISSTRANRWYTYDTGKTGWPLQYERIGSATATPTTHYPDALGRDTAVMDPAGHRTSTYYAASGLGNTDSTRTPNGQVTRYTHDGWGRLVSTRDPYGAVTSDTLDVLNRLLKVTGPVSGDSTKYQYDALDKVITVTDGKGQAYTYQRNSQGWVAKFLFPGTLGSDSTAYDVGGNVVYAKTRASRQVALDYDALGRVTKKRSLTSNDSITYAYDPAGRWVTARSVVGGTTVVSEDTIYTDSLGRTTKEHTDRGTSVGKWDVLSTYAVNDARAGVTAYKNGTTQQQVGYTYDALQRLAYITIWNAYTTRFTYNADQLHDTTIFTFNPNELRETWEYTSSHALAKRSYSVAAVQSSLDRAYRTDSLARLVERSIGTAGKFQDFTYDLKGRIWTWGKLHQSGTPTCTNLSGYGYDCSSSTAIRDSINGTTFDAVGNNTDLGAVIGTGNRLTTYSGLSMTYDADGNLRTKGADTLIWDDFGQLKSVRRAGVQVAAFEYDGFGRRVRKTTGAGTVQYVWDGDQVIVEDNGTPTNTKVYSYYPGADRMHSIMIGGGTPLYASTEPATGDVNGLIRATDNAVMAQYAYTPWGELEVDSTNIGNSLRWKGLQYDHETGLYYMRARYYDPKLRRFISEDPIGLNGGINEYAFANGDPINGSDPSGLLTPVDCPISAQRMGYKPLVDADGVVVACVAPPGRQPDPINIIGHTDGRNDEVEFYGHTYATNDPLAGVRALASLMNTVGDVSGINRLGEGADDLVKGNITAGTWKVATSIPIIPDAAPARIFSARVLLRMAEEAGPFHNFPAVIGEQVLRFGQRTQVSSSYVLYEMPGFVNGAEGVFQVGVRPSPTGTVETITHWFFKPF